MVWRITCDSNVPKFVCSLCINGWAIGSSRNSSNSTITTKLPCQKDPTDTSGCVSKDVVVRCACKHASQQAARKRRAVISKVAVTSAMTVRDTVDTGPCADKTWIMALLFPSLQLFAD